MLSSVMGRGCGLGVPAVEPLVPDEGRLRCSQEDFELQSVDWILFWPNSA